MYTKKIPKLSQVFVPKRRKITVCNVCSMYRSRIGDQLCFLSHVELFVKFTSLTQNKDTKVLMLLSTHQTCTFHCKLVTWLSCEWITQPKLARFSTLVNRHVKSLLFPPCNTWITTYGSWHVGKVSYITLASK
jgi:hypothetical protein